MSPKEKKKFRDTVWPKAFLIICITVILLLLRKPISANIDVDEYKKFMIFYTSAVLLFAGIANILISLDVVNKKNLKKEKINGSLDKVALFVISFCVLIYAIKIAILI